MLWCLDLFQAFSCSLFHSSCCSSTSAGLNRLDQNVYLPKLIQRCLDNKCHKKGAKISELKKCFLSPLELHSVCGWSKGLRYRWDWEGADLWATTSTLTQQKWGQNLPQCTDVANEKVCPFQNQSNICWKSTMITQWPLTITSFIHWEGMWHGLLWWAQICWPQGYKGGVLRGNKHFLRETRGLCDVP